MCRLRPIRRPDLPEAKYLPIPLIKQTIDVRVVDLAASVSITQFYTNTEENPIGMLTYLQASFNRGELKFKSTY